MKGPEIGALLGVDYGTVSRNRKRFMERMVEDRDVMRLFQRICKSLS